MIKFHHHKQVQKHKQGRKKNTRIEIEYTLRIKTKHMECIDEKKTNLTSYIVNHSWRWIVEKAWNLINRIITSWWWQCLKVFFSLWIWGISFHFGVKSMKWTQCWNKTITKEEREREDSIYICISYDCNCKVNLWCKEKNFIKTQNLIQQKPKQPCALRVKYHRKF